MKHNNILGWPDGIGRRKGRKGNRVNEYLGLCGKHKRELPARSPHYAEIGVMAAGVRPTINGADYFQLPLEIKEPALVLWYDSMTECTSIRPPMAKCQYEWYYFYYYCHYRCCCCHLTAV